MKDSSDEVHVQNIPANIGFHSFTSRVADRIVRFEVMKFKDSIYLWIGDGRCRNFGDLSLALLSRYSTEPTSTQIMGNQTNLTSLNLANKLTKKLKKPMYVSYNLPDDRLTTTVVNERISEEVKNNPQFF